METNLHLRSFRKQAAGVARGKGHGTEFGIGILDYHRDGDTGALAGRSLRPISNAKRSFTKQLSIGIINCCLPLAAQGFNDLDHAIMFIMYDDEGPMNRPIGSI